MNDQNIYRAPQSELTDQHEQIEYAGFWVRFAASIIDTILILAVTWPILFTIYGTEYFTGAAFSSGLWDVLLSYVFPAVAVVLFWVYKSATPGKMMLKLKVVKADTHENLSAPQALGRYLGYYLSMIPLFLGFIWVGFDARKQGWHDKLANTVVIKSP